MPRLLSACARARGGEARSEALLGVRGVSLETADARSRPPPGHPSFSSLQRNDLGQGLLQGRAEEENHGDGHGESEEHREG